MSKIYNLSLKYRFVLWYVKLFMRIYYSKIVVNGAENIPQNGHFIFAPNHRNALLDAFAILYITPKNISTTFLARSDLFKNKFIAKLLRFSKIMPAFRIRDGYENLSKNNEVFNECVDLLENSHALCIMPEGNQEIEQRIRPLVKGIFRIAFSVQQNNKSNESLKIVPVGLDFGSITKFGKPLVINIGKSIDIKEYSADYENNPANAMNNLKTELSKRLESLSIHIPTEKYYNTIVQAIDFSYFTAQKKKGVRPTIIGSYNARKTISEKLNQLVELNSGKIENLEELCNEYSYRLKKYKLKSYNIEHKERYSRSVAGFFLTIISSPIALIGYILNVLPFELPVIIRKLLKVEFEGFYGSIQFALGMITFPVFYCLQTILLSSIFSLNLQETVILFFTHFISGIITYNWYCLLRKSLAFLRLRIIGKRKRRYLKEIRHKIHAITLRPIIYNQP